ncbi:MAG: four helix bundle protein [Candidatus Omnitrophota bacterium]
MAFLFESLSVYKKAVDFAEAVCKICDNMPKGNYHLSDQLNRASISIFTNIAEGNGRWHKKEKVNFFYISRGSAHECVPLLDLCRRRLLITPPEHEKLILQPEEIAKMIAGLIKGCKNEPNK